MFKMSNACKYHGHIMLVTVINALLVFNRTPGLDNGSDPCFMSQFN